MMSDLQCDARQSQFGRDLSIGQRVQIGAIGGPAESVSIGDNTQLGNDVRILAPRVTIGDYAVIHNHTTIYGYDEITIGDCCWIGQNAILNCTAPLTIGRGCTISALSNLWTHFSGGDPIEGCRFNSNKPATLGDDVWIGVQASIAPVNIGEKAVVLAGSVVTKDIPANRIFGGNPAVDLTEKLGSPYTDVPVEQKFEQMCSRLRDYHTKLRNAQSLRSGIDTDEFAIAQQAETFRLGGITITMTEVLEDGTSVFDVRDRSYSKLRTAEEIGFMNFLLPLIKFYPRALNDD